MENEAVTVALNAPLSRRLSMVRGRERERAESKEHRVGAGSGQVEPEQVDSSYRSMLVNGNTASMIAGYVAGSAGLLIGHPMDSLKVLIQTQGQAAAAASAAAPTTASAAASRGAGPIGANTKAIASSLSSMAASNNNATNMQQQQTRGKAMAAFPMPQQQAKSASTAAKRSLVSLYAGIGTPLMSIGFVQSLNFFMYDSLRRQFHYRGQSEEDLQSSTGLEYLNQDSIANVSQAAFAAGTFMSLITNPLMLLKTTQQLHPQLSMRGALQHITAGNGSATRSLFRGYVPHLVCETFGRAAYFGAYETLKRFMSDRNKMRGHEEEDGLSMVQRMGSASVAGMTSWCVIYPWDVIRCRMYASGANGAAAGGAAMPSMTQICTQIYRDGGNSIRPFFRGFGITVLRAGPVAAVVLPVYDVTLEWLNKQ